jgi:hypothetical protein
MHVRVGVLVAAVLIVGACADDGTDRSLSGSGAPPETAAPSPPPDDPAEPSEAGDRTPVDADCATTSCPSEDAAARPGSAGTALTLTATNRSGRSSTLGPAYFEEVPGPDGGWLAVTETECSRANGTIRVGNIYVMPTNGYTSQWVQVQLWFRNQWTNRWQYLSPSQWSQARNTGDPATSAAVFERGAVFGTAVMGTVFAPWDVVVRGSWAFNDGTVRTVDLWIQRFINQYPGGSHWANQCAA